jgi:hypothetical protein
VAATGLVSARMAGLVHRHWGFVRRWLRVTPTHTDVVRNGCDRLSRRPTMSGAERRVSGAAAPRAPIAAAAAGNGSLSAPCECVGARMRACVRCVHMRCVRMRRVRAA